MLIPDNVRVCRVIMMNGNIHYFKTRGELRRFLVKYDYEKEIMTKVIGKFGDLKICGRRKYGGNNDKNGKN